MKGCLGCEHDFEEAVRVQDEDGLFYATHKHGEIDFRKHFHILMVDEKGRIIWS